MLTPRLRRLIKTPLLVCLLLSALVHGQETQLVAEPPVDVA